MLPRIHEKNMTLLDHQDKAGYNLTADQKDKLKTWRKNKKNKLKVNK